MLCLRAASNVVLADLAQVRVILTDLVKTHRDTTVIGRTLGQQAVPTTFGAIAVGWLESVVEAKEDLEGAVGKLPVQYAGAAGNLASSYPDGLAIHDALASELDLAASPLVWHANRVPLVRVSNALATVAGAVRKIAGDVVLHAATEVSELREAAPGGSSAMPHKANPAAAVACDGYARRAPGLAATTLDAIDQRMQRATGAWQLTAARIHTVGDLTRADPGWIRRRFSIVLERTVRELNGIRCIGFYEPAAHPTTMIHSRMPGHKLTEPQDVLDTLVGFSAVLGRRMRDKQVIASVFTISASTGWHVDAPVRSGTSLSLAAPTTSAASINLSTSGTARQSIPCAGTALRNRL